MGLDSALSESRNHYGQRDPNRPIKSSSDGILQDKAAAETWSSDNSGVQQLISQGLRSSPRTLPSLLLWDSVGLDLYEKITESPDYYLTSVEADVIRNNIDAIVQSIGANGVILELGSGSLSKTSIILGEFAKREMPVTYFALDLCASSLAKSLKELCSCLDHSPFVTCHPLCMTYQDGVSWVANRQFLSEKRVTVLWLGSSLANEPVNEFQDLVNGITAAYTNSSSTSNIQFLIGVDGNKDISTVSRAYDTSNGLSRQFTLNGINNVNRALGADVFDTAKWAFNGTWDPQEEAFHTSIKAVEDQEMMISGQLLKISKGENIRFIISRKLSRSQFETWLTGTALQTMTVWKHSKFSYGLYQLAPTSKPML
ncbi:histidine-specific methyltransferase [Trichoderma austrokoningii]